MKNITGLRFGRLTVLQRAGSTSNRAATWLCQCDCGKQSVVCGSDLRKGHTKSCGCLSRETSRIINTKHGDRKARLYGIWRSMRQRCNNPRAKDFHRYGGRGIAVAREWEDYPTFKTWALSSGYKDSLTIERIDVNAGYAPSNCTWIPLAEQAQNKRKTIRRDGMSLRKYCRVHGLSYWRELQRAHKER